MSFSSNDLWINIESISDSTLNCVIGQEVSFNIQVKNLSLTDPLYNGAISLFVPDGLVFVSASILETNKIVSNTYNTTVTFVDIKDFYPNENMFTLTVTLSLGENFLATGLPVPYDYTFSNLGISISGDSMPRGNADVNNEVFSYELFAELQTLRYKSEIIYPPEMLKGEIYSIVITLFNSSRDESNIDFSLDFGNGIEYLGSFVSSGTDSSSFLNPILTGPNLSMDYSNISFSNALVSKGSVTTLSFNISLSNNFTQNGILNSGATIYQDSIILSELRLGFYYMMNFGIKALSFRFKHFTTSHFTDVGQTTTYTLEYMLSNYSTASDINFIFKIPNGMSYVDFSSSTTPDAIVTSNFETSISWSFANLSLGAGGTITLDVLTNEFYGFNSDLNYVYSTDVFTTSLAVSYFLDGALTSISETDTYSLIVAPPSISTLITGYSYNDFSLKTFNTAALGDYVGIKIIYDSSNIIARQKDVSIFDYPPLNLSTESLTNINITPTLPIGADISTIPNNGILFSLLELPNSSYFEFDFLLLTGSVTPSLTNNLVKCTLTNNLDVTYSLRTFSPIFLGVPYVEVNEHISPQLSTISYNTSVTYTLTVSNTYHIEPNYVADAFNFTLLATIPSIFSTATLVNTNIPSDSSINFLDFSSNILNLDILKLSANSAMTISKTITLTSLPTNANTCTFSSSYSNGTSQIDPASSRYTTSPTPYTSTLNLDLAIPNIDLSLFSKNITENTFYDKNPTLGNLNDVIGYNFILDNIGNGVGHSLCFSTTIPSSLTYLSSSPLGIYDDTSRVFSTTLPNLSPNSTTSITLLTQISSNDNFLIAENSGSLSYTRYDALDSLIINKNSNLVTLNLDSSNNLISRFQRNLTLLEDFTQKTIRVFLDQVVEYKVVIFNNFTETIKNINIVETFSPYFTFLNFLPPSLGTVTTTQNTITLSIDSLPPLETVELIYTTKLSSSTIALSSSSSIVTYNFSLNLNTHTKTSNVLFLRLSNLGRGFNFY